MGTLLREPRRLRTAVIGVAAVALAAAGTTAWLIARPGGRAVVDCSASPYRDTITTTVRGDVEITAPDSVCSIRGTVTGDVTVRNQSCETQGPVTALSLDGGSIEGDVHAVGELCVMVWLYDGGSVGGDIVYEAAGNLGFLGDAAGATVHGDVLLRGGLLWAAGASTNNRVGGDVACDGGQPKEGLGSGSETNWDGFEDDVDGTVGGAYRSC